MAGYTPAQTVQRTGFTIETLRYYERAGLIGTVRRDESGHRVYTDDDIAWLDVLHCLRQTGMPVATMRRYAELALDTGDDTIPERVQILIAHAAEVDAAITRLQGQRTHLADKITHYQAILSEQPSVDAMR